MKSALAHLMKEKGVTAYQIEKTLGISEGAVRGWLKGNIPRADHLMKIADMLEVEPRSLITGTTPVNNETQLLLDRIAEFCHGYPKGVVTLSKVLDLFIATYTKEKNEL